MKKLISFLLPLVCALSASDLSLPVSGVLSKPVRLGEHSHLAVKARSIGTRGCRLNINITRELTPGDRATYSTALALTDSFQTFYIPLIRSSSRTAVAFHYKKGTPRCSIDPLNSGRLLSLKTRPENGNTGRVEIQSIKLTTHSAPLSPEMAAAAEKVKNMPLVTPYVFKELLPGKPVPAAGFVICRTGSTLTEKFAAAELSRYLKKVTGKDFPVVKRGSKKILLKVVPGPKTESFTSQFTDGKTVTITGASPRGLLYGVYDFLEKAAGIRWFAPFDYGEVVPSNPDLAFPLFRDSVDPVMSFRSPHYCSGKKTKGAAQHLWAMADWCVKNRMNVELERIRDRKKIVSFYARRGDCIWLSPRGGHSYHKFVPPAKYFKSNPDFYPLDPATGKRRAWRAQLCCTNKELFKELGKIGDTYFKTYPHVKIFYFAQMDGALLWCHCPGCLAITPKGAELHTASDRVVNMANNVAREIRKKHPDVMVRTFAYGLGRKPPENIKPSPDVIIRYCHYTRGNVMPWATDSGEYLRKWAELTKGNVEIYSYNQHNIRYGSTIEAQVALIRLMKVLKIKGTHQETTETWSGIDAYLFYLMTRLAVEPALDEAKIRADYYSKFYGSAAPELLKCMEILDGMLADPGARKRIGFMTLATFSEGHKKEIRALLDRAVRKSAKDSRQLKAVRAQQIGFEGWFAYSDVICATDAFYKAPVAGNFNNAIAAIDTYKKMVTTHAPARLFHGLRFFNKVETGLRTYWANVQKENELLKSYSVVSDLREWKFAVDPHNKGEKEKWYHPAFDDRKWTTVQTGMHWEKQGFPNYDGVAWYRAKVTVPHNNNELFFLGVDEKAWVYLDGKYIGGQHEGDVGVLWQKPFKVRLNKGPGVCTVVIKVLDSSAAGGIYKPIYLIRPAKGK